MKKITKIFQTISIVLGFLVIIIFLIPMLIGIKPFIVQSGSMEKEIKTGSIAYINTHIPVQDIKVGDIIAFSVDTKQVTHRVISINENNTFTTKGDANQTEDLSPVKFENYKGKTIFSIPYIGYILSSIQTKTGKFILGIIIGLNIISYIFIKDDAKNKE